MRLPVLDYIRVYTNFDTIRGDSSNLSEPKLMECLYRLGDDIEIQGTFE
jgi:hypothetical protein